MKLEMIMVCLTKGDKCEEDGFIAEVGKETHLFCCQHGFEQSLEDFREFDNQERKGHQNN